MKKKNTKLKVRNFVQMHVMEFNRPTVFKDKKKELKKGYQKHKGHKIAEIGLNEKYRDDIQNRQNQFRSRIKPMHGR